MKNLQNKSGAVFITVLIISMLVLFVAASSSNMLLQDAKMVRYLKRSAQARYLAEAGVNAALGVLLEEGINAKDDASNFPETNMGDGSYDVTVIESGGRILLSSVGTVDGTSRTVSAEVQDLYPEALDYPLATGGDLIIKSVQGNVTVKGNVHANGNLNFSEQGPGTQLEVEAYAGMSGRATSSGSWNTSGNVSIADLANSGGGEPLISMPNFNLGYFQSVAEDLGVYHGSSQTFTNATLSGGSAGITYVDGSATFRGTCYIYGGFVAKGTIQLNNGNFIYQYHDTDNRFPIFMSQAGLKLYGYFDTQEGNIIYATNDVDIRTTGGTSAVIGNVISGGTVSIVANNNVVCTYYQVEAGEVVPSGVEIVSWNR